MALTYHNDHGGYFVKLGIGIQSLSDLPGGVNYPFMDPIPRLIGGASWELGWVHCEDTLAMYRQNGDSSVYKVGGYQPPTLPYDPQEDYQRYGSNLSAIAAAVRMLSGQKALLFDPGVEHQTAHLALRGDVGAPLSGGEFFGYDNPSWTVTQPLNYYGNFNVPAYVAPGTHGWLQQWLAIRRVGMETVFEKLNYTQVDYAYRHDVIHTLDYVISNYGGSLDAVGSFPWCTWYTNVRNLRYESEPGKLTIRYEFEWGECGQYFWVWDMSLILELDYLPPAADHHPVFAPGDTYADSESIVTAELGTFVYKQRCVLLDKDGTQPPEFGTPPVGYVYERSETRHNGFIYLTDPVQGSKDGDTPDWSSLGRTIDIGRFRELINQDFGSIRLSAFQSTSDALTSITGSIDNNLVEVIGEVDEISRLLPEISSAILAIRRLRKGNALGALVSTLDFLTALKLQKSFSWDPNMDLLFETLPRMERVADQIRNLSDSGFVVGRGSFTYDFPTWEFGREECRLVTRTKVVASLNTKSVLAKTLGVRALGLLPSPSSLWDLIPFSFVVDWFGNIGARLHDLESIGFLSLMGVRSFTHTYLIESKLTQDEMERVGITPWGASSVSYQPAMRYFVREVSGYIPPIGNGKWDFRLPGKLPDWALSGSLAWQLLR